MVKTLKSRPRALTASRFGPALFRLISYLFIYFCYSWASKLAPNTKHVVGLTQNKVSSGTESEGTAAQAGEPWH